MSFPKDFIWGAATASYQIEGAVTEDGRGVSIWDTFSHAPGNTLGGDTGDVACDSYHRWREDIALMQQLGLKSYRFSAAWPRVCPNGDATVNEAGLAWYETFVDELLAKNIEPCLTLYHWDLPQVLQDVGGWLNPATAEAFTHYVAAMANRLKGKVKRYVTINEIECAARLGYGTGEHAPGYKLSEPEQFTAWRNIIYAHCLACKVIREIDPDAVIGFATTGRVCYPATDSTADIDAARKEMFTLTDGEWGFTHGLALDPICLGKWPETDAERGKILAKSIAAVPQYQLDALKFGKPDFIALNIYNGSGIKAGTDGKTPEYLPYPTYAPHTAIGWPITPESLEWGPRFIAERYGLPIFISENGLSCNDKVYLDGKIHDVDRIDFLNRYLLALRRASEAGADVRGYYQWSLLDNFEWAHGYSQRFGLVYVDYATGKRTPKDSAAWYAEVVKTNGENL